MDSDRGGPLHLRWREEDPRAAPPKGDAADVVYDRPRGARHDADDARLAGQRALALGREETLRGELRLQLLEGLEQRSSSGGLEAVGDELQPAARGPEGRGLDREGGASLRRRTASACAP